MTERIQPKRFLVLGSTTYDRVCILKEDEQLEGRKPLAEPNSYEAAGGGAINMFNGVKLLSRALDLPVFMDVYTRVGPHQFIADETTIVNNPNVQDIYVSLHGHALHDMARHQKYVLPRNTVVIANDRGIIRDPLANAYNKKAMGLDSDTLSNIRDHAGCADYILLQTRDPQLSNAAAMAASDHATVITDCDVSDEAHMLALWDTLKNSHIIRAPEETLMPGMTEPNGEELLHRLLEFSTDNGGKAELIAVSNSHHPVHYWYRGEFGEIPVVKVKTVDNNGIGDHSDAFVAVGLAVGFDALESLNHTIALSELFVAHAGRDWAKPENLHPFLRERNLFKFNEMAPDFPNQVPQPGF